MKKIKMMVILHSQMHLNAFRAYYSILEKKGVHAVGDIYVKGDPKNGYLINEEDCLFAEGFFFHKLQNNKTWMERITFHLAEVIASAALILSQSKGRTLLLLKPSNRPFSTTLVYRTKKAHRAGNVRMVMLEEGIGDYIRDEERWKIVGIELMTGHKRILRYIKKNIIYYTESQRVIQEFEKRGDTFFFHLLRKKNGRYIPNKRICKAFKEVYEERSKELGIRKNYHRVILINSQPFMEEYGNDSDLICYSKIHTICKNNGIRLVVKPHPREMNLDRYRSIGLDVDYSDHGISQEILLAGAEEKPMMIIGFFSTTLITAKLYYSIPVMCLGRLDNFESIPEFGKDITQFIETFSELLSVPEDYQEAECMIRDLACIKEGE